MSETYDKGMEIRRQVLGEDYVEKASRQATDLDRDFQRWITENAWAGVWGREHLDRRTKSLVTIAILAALGHEELELHLEASRRTGATPEDIAEVLFHVGVYSGLPNANQAFKRVKRVFEPEREGDREPTDG